MISFTLGGISDTLMLLLSMIALFNNNPIPASS